MATTTNDAEQAVKDLLPALSAPQRQFILARIQLPNDREAAKLIGKTNMRFLVGWKNKPQFLEAYLLVTKIVEPSNKLLALPATDRDTIVQQQVESFARVLPKVVQEHINIIFSAEATAVRLKAIEKLYDIVGLDSGALIRVSRRNKVLVQMLEMLAPQLQSIAESRGIEKSPVDEFIDAQYEVEDDGGNE